MTITLNTVRKIMELTGLDMLNQAVACGVLYTKIGNYKLFETMQKLGETKLDLDTCTVAEFGTCISETVKAFESFFLHQGIHLDQEMKARAAALEQAASLNVARVLYGKGYTS